METLTMSRLHQLKRLGMLEPKPKERAYAVQQIVVTQSEYEQMLPQSQDDKGLRIIRIILKDKPRSEPIIFKEGCPMDSEGLFPQGAQVGDKYIKEGIEYAIQEN
jgi:hypothetical protein